MTGRTSTTVMLKVFLHVLRDGVSDSGGVSVVVSVKGEVVP